MPREWLISQTQDRWPRRSTVGMRVEPSQQIIGNRTHHACRCPNRRAEKSYRFSHRVFMVFLGIRMQEY